MHPLHDYISTQLAERLKARKIVVWYDGRREFASFIAELRGGARTTDEAVPVAVGGTGARLMPCHFGAPFTCHIDHKGSGFVPRFDGSF